MDIADVPKGIGVSARPEREDGRHSSAGYIEALRGAKEAYRRWNDVCDKIDREYASLAAEYDSLDREYKLFWANVEVLQPAVYSRTPVPVVKPRFHVRKPLLRESSETLERALISEIERSSLHQCMIDVRNDLIANARGVAWCTFAMNGSGVPETVQIESLDRRDFLHEPARKWQEVTWVAKGGWMTKREVRDRFGDEAAEALQYGNQDERDNEKRARIWEVWDKREGRVVFIHEEYEHALEVADPPYKLDTFWPCPKPAFGTLDRRRLIPQPDFLQYRDQLEEINLLTRRVSGLLNALRVRALIPGGASGISDALKQALSDLDDRVVTIPVENWAAFGPQGPENSVVYLPLAEVAQTLQIIIAARRELMRDVYEIAGIGDIQRAQTDPNETATAQQLKSQYGASRLKNKQAELVRFSRDMVAIIAEMMAELFSPEALAQLSVSDLPRQEQIDAQIAQLERQAYFMQQNMAQAQMQARSIAMQPQVQQMAAQNPDQAQALVQQAEAQFAQMQQQAQALQGQIEELRQTVTLDAVHELLAAGHMRPFVLEIENDSTVMPDEQREKELRGEFMQVMTNALKEMVPSIAMTGGLTGELVAEGLRFLSGAYRAGRSMEGVLDEFTEKVRDGSFMQTIQQMQEQQKPPPDPRVQAEAQLKAQEAEAARYRLEIEGETARADLGKTEAEINEIIARTAHLQAQTRQLGQKEPVNG